MINRVILLVIDGLGAGALPDAPMYHDGEAHTLSRLAEAVDGLNLPTLEALGLGHVNEIKGLRVMAQPLGCFGRLGFQSHGVDSLLGHWELAGCVVKAESPDFSSGYPQVLLDELERLFERPTLGNRVTSAMAAVAEFQAQHLTSKEPIVWTDGRRTCHVAAHETIVPTEDLWRMCREARKELRDAWGIWRLVAHPLVGTTGALQLASKRRDFAIEPPNQTMLDILSRAGQILIAVGKVGDLFSGRGLTRTAQIDSWTAAFDEVNGMFSTVPRGLIYAALNVLEGDAGEAASSLHDFDRRLPELLEQLRPGDLLILTGDHGRDPSKAHWLPTREYVPVILSGPKLAQGVNLGIRPSAADLGQTIVEALRGEPLPAGESFLDALQAG